MSEPTSASAPERDEGVEETSIDPEAAQSEAPAQESEPEESVETAPDPEADIARLEDTIEELNNQMLRRQADFENSRKRLTREKQEAVQFANQQLLLDLVSVIDDFERAIKSADDSRDYDAFHDGIVIIEKQLTGMLERKWGLSRFDSAGLPFDPQRHQAVATEEVDDVESETVLEEYQKGYLLHDRVIRSAKVKVAKEKQNETEETEE